MYNLYDMLKNGKSVDEIADAFTDELNAAIQKKKEEDEAAENASKKELKKREMAENIAFDLTTLVENCYPDLIDPEAEERIITGETLLQLLDSVEKMQKTLNGFKITLHNEITPVENKITDDISRVFRSFFNKYGL